MPAARSSHPFAGWLVRAVALGVLAGLVWLVPLVRFKRLDAITSVADAFDPRAFAERFWSADLAAACDTAGEIGGVLAAVRSDPAAACRTHGRSPGLSRTCLYLVRGSGTIADVGPTACRVTLAGDAGEVELATGLVFGTAIRDVTGTVDPASRTDSRDLAAAAAEINRLAQERAIAPLKAAAAAGRTVEFVACGQVQGTLPGDKPWRLIPVRITLHEAPSGSAGAPR
jgi:predicted lipoprotein